MIRLSASPCARGYRQVFKITNEFGWIRLAAEPPRVAELDEFVDEFATAVPEAVPQLLHPVRGLGGGRTPSGCSAAIVTGSVASTMTSRCGSSKPNLCKHELLYFNCCRREGESMYA
jgi:hypothetical protein